MRTTLNDTPVFDHENPIRQAHSAEAVADEDCRFPPGQRAKVGEDLVLGLRIKSAGRLVEHENTGIAHECSRQRNLLPLAATQLCALLQVLKPPPKHRVVALRELLDDGVGPALARGTFDQFPLFDLVHAPYADVFLRSHVVVHIILEDHANLFAQILQVVFFDIATADQDLASIRVVQTRKELDQRCLARAVAPNKRYGLTCAYGETHVFQGRVCLGVLPWIGEADIAELYVEPFYLRC